MTLNERCTVKIRPFPNDTEIQCEVVGLHVGHKGTLRNYAYPGSQTIITWETLDRRTFTGDWIECTTKGCVLPLGHRGDCAS